MTQSSAKGESPEIGESAASEGSSVGQGQAGKGKGLHSPVAKPPRIPKHIDPETARITRIMHGN